MSEVITWRVIGFTSNGTVVISIACSEGELEKIHELVMSTDKVTLASTIGPFVYSRTADE